MDNLREFIKWCQKAFESDIIDNIDTLSLGPNGDITAHVGEVRIVLKIVDNNTHISGRSFISRSDFLPDGLYYNE